MAKTNAKTNAKREFDKVMAAWERLKEVRGLSGGCVARGVSSLMDKHGYLGGVADEMNLATREGRERIRALVDHALKAGWCCRHRENGSKQPPSGKLRLAEAFCPKCGKRPSYCECRAGA